MKKEDISPTVISRPKLRQSHPGSYSNVPNEFDKTNTSDLPGSSGAMSNDKTPVNPIAPIGLDKTSVTPKPMASSPSSSNALVPDMIQKLSAKAQMLDKAGRKAEADAVYKELDGEIAKAGLAPKKESFGGGFMVPIGIRVRKQRLDNVFRKSPDISEGAMLSYLFSLTESSERKLRENLDLEQYACISDEVREFVARQVAQKKVKEVVRKKPGGGGYVLYAPNKGKKGSAKSVGNFPTKSGAKRAELARFPPKDPAKLARLRKEVERLIKDPKKDDKKAKESGAPIKPKKEGALHEDQTALHSDLNSFMSGLKALPKVGPERGKYITSHMGHAPFVKALQSHPQGKQIHSQLMGFLNGHANAGAKAPARVSAEGLDVLHRKMIGKVIKESLTRSLSEGLFQEEASGGSDWDEYIKHLSKNSLSSDKKFNSLQRNIDKKTEGALNNAFGVIRKAVDRDVKLKSFGVKRSEELGKTYLAFSATIGQSAVEPIYIYIENGVPKIELSANSKAALVKCEPAAGKAFRAELVTVQERVLDEMDDILVAVQNRDKYLNKSQGSIDDYVSKLTPLQISILKQLLVKKYRKL